MSQHPIADQMARRYHIPPWLFRRLIKQESGWDPHAHSPAGAEGYTQLMPGTAKGLHVNPHDPRQNLEGGARYLAQMIKRFHGRLDLALSAYNSGPGGSESSGRVEGIPETQNYVHSILQNRPRGGVSTAEARSTPSGLGAAPGPPQPVAEDNLQERGMALLQAVQPGPGHGDYGPLFQLLQQHVEAKAADEAKHVLTVHKTHPALKPLGRVILAVGADRSGVHTSPAVLRFVRQLAGLARTTLTIGTGTQHNRLTVNGNVSDHWSGHAADIPATGKNLIHLGRLALVAAGADPKWAMRQKGGLFNVHGHQIIFNTHIGGDHTNHLHVSSH